MKTTKLTLAVFLLLNLNSGIRLQDPEDQIDEIDDSGLTSLGSMVKQQNSLKDKTNLQTKKESDIESSKPTSDAGEPKIAVAQKEDDAAAAPAKEEAPKDDKADEVSTKDFEIKTDEFAQKDAENIEKKIDVEEKQAGKEGEEKQKEQKVVPKDGLIKIREILTNTATNELYQEAISRKDGLNHLLLSDVNLLLTSIANDFPDIAKTYSIGQSFEGRDINVIEISGNGKVSEEKAEPKIKEQKPKSATLAQGEEQASTDELLQIDENQTEEDKPEILMTGATHARELISTSLNVYEMLKLLKHGAVEKDPHFEKLLNQNRYFFLPILNVDGVNMIEENWVKNKKIIPHRKSADKTLTSNCLHPEEDIGVDLNRNFGIDFGQVDPIVKYQGLNYDADDSLNAKDPMKILPCEYNYPGPKAFSEPETIAYKNFLTQHQKDMSFVINMHSNGNAFIYPFNGRQKNDIEERRPGIMNIFSQISKEAPFPQGEMKGTSKELMGITIGGDQDDWTLGELGIPSVTSEIGYVGQFINEWQVKESGTGNDIVSEQAPWLEYIFQHLPEYHEIIESNRAPKTAPAAVAKAKK